MYELDLLNILDKMKEQANNSDTEVAHINADDLLIETLQTIAPKCSPTIGKLLETIIKEYTKVPKWYA